MFFPLVLLLVSVLPQMASDAHRSDALALLTEVSQKYADAKSYHIEAVEERISSGELQHSWQKTLFTAILAPGNRYRYGGRSGYAAAVIVSDGTTQWVYHLNEHRYTQSSRLRRTAARVAATSLRRSAVSSSNAASPSPALCSQRVRTNSPR